MFSYWQDWVELYEEQKHTMDAISDKQKNTSIRPMGEQIGPEWMKNEFKDLEEFYQYYCELLNIGDKNGK